MTAIVETGQLNIRPFVIDDAAMMLSLLNDPGWLRFIGDRSVRTMEQARTYLENGALENYRRLGYGFYCVELKSDQTPIGMCGLTQRDYLDAPDLGFALFADYAGHGYAKEAAAAVLHYAKQTLRLKRVLATTRLDNAASIKVLGAIGMQLEQVILHPDGDRELNLFAIDLTREL